MFSSRDERGFTFLEVMIAFSILALALISIFHLQTQNIALGSRARFNTLAPLLAREKLADILSDPNTGLSEKEGDFGKDAPGYGWKVGISDVVSEYFQETARRLKKIEVTVLQEDPADQYHLQTYYFFDQEGPW